MKALLVKDRFNGRSVLADMLGMVPGVELVATVTGCDVGITWLATHPAEWDCAVVELEQDYAQIEVIAFASAAHPEGKIVAVGNIVVGPVRSECLRSGAAAGFDSRHVGDLAAWLDRQTAGGF